MAGVGQHLEEQGLHVGAIGVSGGEVSQDMDVAEAGVERWDELTE